MSVTSNVRWHWQRRALSLTSVASWLAPLAVVLSLLFAPEAGAQPAGPAPTQPAAPSAAAPAPLEFRRVFVPAERTADWPTGGAQYLPLERTEFERLVQQAEQRRQLGRVSNVQLLKAGYVAKLTESDVLEGVATFDLKLIDDRPSILMLDRWDVVILRGRWLGEDEADDAAPATLGLWSRDDGQQESYGLLVERSGTAELNWQAAPERRGKQLEFLLRLPLAVAQELTLELPANVTPAVASGRLMGEPTAVPGVSRRWTFQLAAGTEHRLVLTRAAAANAKTETALLPLAAVTEAYHLTRDGADYEAELRIQQRGSAVAEFRLQAPPTLHIAGVTVNRQPVKWRRDVEDAKLVVIPLPSADADGANRSLAVVAISGAASATFDAPWQLPSAVPQDVFWTEGTSTLWVDPTLEIRSLSPRECSLLNVVGVGSGAAGEVYRLQAWSPLAAAELVLGDRQESLRYRSATAVEFAERDLAARASLKIWGEGGRTFHLAAPLADEWSIDSVVAAPAEDLVEWHVEEGEGRRLHVQLRRSPTESLPLSLTVNARKPWRAWTRMAAVSDLSFLQFPGVGEDRWLIAKDRRGNEVIPDAKLAEAVVVATELPPADQELLGDAAGGLLIDLNDAASNAFVSVASTPVTFTGEAWMEISPVAAGYEHRAEILCRPASGAVGELRVFAARDLPADAVWELGTGAPLAVERISPPPAAAAGLTDDPSAVVGAPIEYRVRLPQPSAGPFRMRASWRSTAPADAAVNLLSLPDAQTWQAWAVFRGQPNQVAVEARGAAVAVALPPQTAADELPAIACFRLGDDPVSPLAAPPRFVAAAKKNLGQAPTSGAVAWRCRAATEQLADGTQNHRIEYEIEASEPTEVQLTVPPSGASFTSVVLDGRSVVATPAADARTVSFRLPGSPALQTLTVTLQRKTPPLARSVKIWPALPRTSFPILDGNWTLRWPVAYEAASGSWDSRANAAEPASWAFRLFGPLSGQSGQRWYDGMLLAHVDAAPMHAGGTNHLPATPGGWDSLSQTFVNRPLPVELRLASGVQANWHFVWLTAAVAAGWLWARSRRFATLLIGVVIVVCLIVPEPLIPLPQAIFLGLVTGAIVRQLVSFLTKPRVSVRRRSPTGSVATLLTCIAATASFAWPDPAAAQAPSAAAPVVVSPAAELATASTNPPTTPTTPPQVLFPVDNEGNPIGADVYVPASMAAELLPAAAGPRAALVDARYQIEIQPGGANGEMAASSAQLRFRWKSSGAQTRVELPLVAADGAIDPASVLLDGQPVVAVWNESGTALSLTLPQPGEHELTATLRPAAALAMGNGQRARLQLHIPRLSGATVEILHPAGVSDVRVVGGAPTAGESNAARSSFRLGPEPMLDVTWPARLEREAAGVAVQQLSVLQLDPVAARVDVRLRLSGDAAAAQSFRVAHSPQLKLLPLPEGSPLEVVGQSNDAEAPGVVEFRFRSPPALPLTLALQFQVQRALSVGRIDYPWVDALGMNVRTRHFAVMTDARLRVRDTATAGLTPVAAAELDSLWNGASAGAWLLYYAAATATPEWSLDVSPTPARFTSRESLELACGEEEVRFDYSAAIADVDGEILVHRFLVPNDVTIDRVTAAVDGPGGAIPVRWSRPQPDHLQLFLSRPLNEPHLVRIVGRVSDAITAAPAGAVADAGLLPAVERHVQVPRIGLEASQAAPIDLNVFRTSDVLVDWSSPAPAAKPPAGPADPARGLFVGQYSLPRGETALPELKVVPNDAQYEADALLTLQLDAVEPTAECRIEGRATRGMVDRLRLIVGKNWRGPFTCDQPAAIESRELSGDATRQLLEVRFARPIPAGEDFSVAIGGPVSLEADQRIRFPALQLANALKQRTFLILPPTAGNLTAEWTLRGLATQPLPDRLAQKWSGEQTPIAYRVQRDRFVAEQRVFPDAMRKPAYRLAESRVSIGPDGAAVVLAQLIVQAGGSADCRIVFPAGAELQYVAVDGAPQGRPDAGTEGWQAPPGSLYLPRLFLLSYRLPPQESGGSLRFEPPHVKIDGKSLAPRTALWQIEEAGNVAMAERDAKSITATQFAATARQQQIEAFLDAYPLASQIAEWELQLWRQPWFDRLSGANAAVAADDPAAWTRLRDRFAASKESANAPSIDPVRQWSQANAENAACFTGGADGAVTLLPITTSWPMARWLAAWTLAAVIGVAWRQPAALRNLALPAQRWPYAAVGVAGVLWWLLLSPSLFGLLLIGFALAAYVKSRR